MADTIFGYVQMANNQPITKYTDADAGQTTVMDNIAGAGDIVQVIINDNPLIIEFSSETIEVDKSYVEHRMTSSPIVNRILFESAEGRTAFVIQELSQLGRLKPALGRPVSPEVVWRDNQFEAAIQSDRTAIEEIEAALDVQTRTLLLDPKIQYLLSHTIHVGETVALVSFPDTTEATRIYLPSALNFIQFVHEFVLPTATATALQDQ